MQTSGSSVIFKERMKHRIKRIITFIASLRVAIVLLALIALYIVIGTLLPQHSSPQWYLQRYPKAGPLILALSLNTIYSSAIFIVLVVLFVINLSLCTALSLKGQLRQLAPSFFPSFTKSEYVIEDVTEEQARTLLRKGRYAITEEEGKIKGGKFRIGVLGAAITHVGLIILFLGGTLGNATSSEDMVNLLPGNAHHFEKEGFTLYLDDFYLTFDESGAVKQYFSEVTVTDRDGTTKSEKLWVNKPFHHKGLGFYQANWGWTSHLEITDLERGEVVAHGLLRNGTSYFHETSHISIYLYGYYPELGMGHQQQPVKISDREIDPYYAVILYEFGNPIGSYLIRPGDPIIWEDLSITFTHSIGYTGLLVRDDISYPIVLTSFLIIILGIFVSFYLYPRFIMYEDGKLITTSRRNGWVFYQSVKSAVAKKERNNVSID